jgi:hypothetical protein
MLSVPVRGGGLIDPSYTAIINSSIDDGVSTVRNIGFNFVYEGVTYTQFSANSNGLIRLGSTVVTNAFSNSITEASNQPKIMPLWDDFSTGNNGSVSFGVSGSAPNQICVIDFKLRNSSTTSSAYNLRFQVRLYETSNVIEFMYETGTTSTSASIGIGDVLETNYLARNHLTNHTFAITGGLNTITAWPGSGRVYTFTPCVSSTWLGGTSTVWTNAANWSCCVPSKVTNVTIPSGTTNSPVIGPAMVARCRDLTINTGGLLEIGNLDASGGSFVISGDVWNEGSIYHTSDLNTNLAGTANTFGGTGEFDYNNEFVSFNIVTGANYTLSSNITLLSQLRISSGASLSLDSYTLGIYNFTFEDGTINLNTGVLQIGGFIDYTTGTFNMNTGTVYFNSGDAVWVDGGFAAANQTINSFTYYNLSVRTNNGRTATLGNGSDITVSNNLVISNPGASGGVARVTSTSVSNGVYVEGTFSLGVGGNGVTLNLGRSFRRATASGTTTFTMGDNDDHIINCSFAWISGPTLAPFRFGASSAVIALTYYGTFNHTFSGTASDRYQGLLGTYKNVTLSGAGLGNFQLIGNTTINGNLTMSSTAGFINFQSHTLDLKGNLINNTSGVTQNPGTSTVTFTGSAQQEISGSAAVTNFYNLTNGMSSGDLVLSQDILVSNTLSMSGTDIDLNGQEIDLDGTGSISGESNTDRIKGTSGLITTTITGFGSPSGVNVGNMGAILTSASDLGDITVSRGHTRQSGVGGNLGIERYYIVTPSNNSGINATLQAEYFSNDVPGGYNESDFALYRSTDNGSTWTWREGTVTVAVGGKGNVELSGINAFSWWTISDHAANPLPVIMKVFNGDCQTDYISLFWQTASEMNSSHFDIERSTDGFEWEVLGSLQGNGNSSSTKDYEWFDHSIVRQAQQTPVYYRLRQVDFDGEEEVFGPISVTCEKSADLNLTVFPNPTQNNATLTFDWNKGKDDVLVTLTDASGKIIQQTETAIMNGTNSIYVELSDYSHGMYFITLEVNEERIGAVKLVKQ